MNYDELVVSLCVPISLPYNIMIVLVIYLPRRLNIRKLIYKNSLTAHLNRFADTFRAKALCWNSIPNSISLTFRIFSIDLFRRSERTSMMPFLPFVGCLSKCRLFRTLIKHNKTCRENNSMENKGYAFPGSSQSL